MSKSVERRLAHMNKVAKERPILFNGEMVRAIQEGRKTQTRRVIKSRATTMQKNGCEVIRRNPDNDRWYKDRVWSIRMQGGSWGDFTHDRFLQFCPYGVPGDRLFVKETHYLYGYFRKTGELTETGKPEMEFVRLNDECFYAENPPQHFYKGRHESTGYYKRPSIFMERRDARILLEVTKVGVERAQDISIKDSAREGIRVTRNGVQNYKDGFRDLWNSINEKRGYGWDKNPWVWVIEFKEIKDDQ